ncbi:MAG: hypothetical protein QM757_26070 [Paludibaculum sp.]
MIPGNEPGELLRAASDAHVQASTPSHSGQTPDCPAFAAFAGERLDDWSDSDLEHISACPYCYKLLAFRFRAECPSLTELVKHLAGTSAFSPAVAMHLSEDECPRCTAILNASWTTLAAAALTAGRLTLQGVSALASATAFAFAPQTAKPEFASPAEKFDLPITAGDGTGIMVATVIKAKSLAVLYVQARGPGMAGRNALVDIRGTRASRRAVVPLEQIGRSASGMYCFGPADELLSELGEGLSLFVGMEP